MNIIKSLKWRYAVKKFDSKKKITKKKINILKKAFNLTATSYGLQPIKMVVIHNKEIQNKLVSHSYNQFQIGEASHVLVLCIPIKFSSKDVEKYFNLVKKIRKSTDNDIANYKSLLLENINNKSQEDIFSWNKNQAYIALGNLLTVCAVEKIDSCPMEGFIAKKYDEILNLKQKNLTSILVLPIGYRDSSDLTSKELKVRKPIEKSVIEI